MADMIKYISDLGTPLPVTYSIAYTQVLPYSFTVPQQNI